MPVVVDVEAEAVVDVFVVLVVVVAAAVVVIIEEEEVESQLPNPL